MNRLVQQLKARGGRVQVDKAGRVVSVRFTDRAIETPDLDLLVQCRTLRRLDLEGSRLDDAGLSRLATIESLESLALHDARITDAGLKQLARLERLKTLGLAGTRIGDAGLAHLGGLVRLEGLVLTNTRITDKGLVHLKPLVHLSDLPVRGTKATFGGVVELFVRHQRRGLAAAVRAMGLAAAGDGPIKRIDLGRTGVRDQDLAHLADMSGRHVWPT